MKDCTTCKYGYEDEQLGFPMCHHPKRFSEDCIDFNMHEEKEIKESEKPIQNDLEEAARRYSIPSYMKNVDENFLDEYPYDKVSETAFIAGAKWQKEQIMKDAVEYEVWDFSSSLEAYPHVNIPLDNKQYRSGDKVRVIVLKKED